MQGIYRHVRYMLLLLIRVDTLRSVRMQDLEGRIPVRTLAKGTLRAQFVEVLIGRWKLKTSGSN